MSGKSNTFKQDQIDNAGTGNITLPNHGLVTGQAVIFHKRTGGDLVLGNNQTYFVFTVNENTIRLANNAVNASNGATLNVVRNGDGEYTLTARDSLVTQTFTHAAVTASHEITLANHGLSTGHAVVYRAVSDRLVGLLQANTAYYVIKMGDNTLKLARSLDDAHAGSRCRHHRPGKPQSTLADPACGGGFRPRQPPPGRAGARHPGAAGWWPADRVVGRRGPGQNSVRVLLDPAATVEGTDQQVWAVTGTDTGGLGDRQTAVPGHDRGALRSDCRVNRPDGHRRGTHARRSCCATTGWRRARPWCTTS